MKKLLAIAICSIPFALAPVAYAQTGSGGGAAGVTSTAANGAAMTSGASGWSVKDNIIGKTVYNENNDKVGSVNDVTISRDGKMTSLVVGAGGFLGMGEHDVAIPFDKFTESGGKLMLAGYTKDQLKALPVYKSRKSDMPLTSGTMGQQGSVAAPGTRSMPGNTTAPSTPAPK